MRLFSFKIIATALLSLQASTEAIDGPSPSAHILEESVTADGRTGTKTMDPDIHRILMGGKCKDDFVCPEHSERKRGRSCYDSFDDCECNLGYKKKNNACVAQKGLCSLEYIDMVEAEQEEVEGWIDKIYGAKRGDEKYGYIEKTNSVLSEAWVDYNKVLASCEMYVFDDEPGGVRRRLFFNAIRKALNKVKEAFVSVAKAVVKAVVTVVETVVAVVGEAIECGVGIAQDIRCGIIGCAFGFAGVAADIAFTLATGGANKLAGTVCSIAEEAGLTPDQKDQKEKAALLTVLNGVAGAVCELNKRIDSRDLQQICDFKDKVAKADNGLLFFEQQLVTPEGKAIFRVLEAFQTAMCGNPGSGVLDLIEELVACKIQCADDNNAFCNANIEEDDKDNNGAQQVAEYTKHGGRACRTGKGGKGKEGRDFTKFTNRSENQCKSICSEDKSCEGFEYNTSSDRCEIWHREPKKFSKSTSFNCYVKV